MFWLASSLLFACTNIDLRSDQISLRALSWEQVLYLVFFIPQASTFSLKTPPFMPFSCVWCILYILNILSFKVSLSLSTDKSCRRMIYFLYQFPMFWFDRKWSAVITYTRQFKSLVNIFIVFKWSWCVALFMQMVVDILHDFCYCWWRVWGMLIVHELTQVKFCW